MNIDRKYRRFIVMGAVVIIGIPLMIRWGNRTAKEYVEIQESAVFLSELAEAIEFGMKYHELTHWQRERWEIDTFFHRPESIEACRIISSKNTNDLKVWIDSGGDVNLTGDHGLTLLHWAMLDRNLPAFKTLLEAGADVDAKLTGYIHRKNDYPLLLGDTVFFSAMTLREFEMLLASLDYTKDVNQICSKQNLLHRSCHAGIQSSISTTVLVKLIEAGVDPNLPTWKYDGYVTIDMVESHLPHNCLALIGAGADPTLVSKEGTTVASVVERNFQTKNEIIFTPGHQKLVDYLIEHQLLDPAFAVPPTPAPAGAVNTMDVSRSASTLPRGR